MTMFDSTFVCCIVNSFQRDNKETQGRSKYLMTGIDAAEIVLIDTGFDRGGLYAL